MPCLSSATRTGTVHSIAPRSHYPENLEAFQVGRGANLGVFRLQWRTNSNPIALEPFRRRVGAYLAIEVVVDVVRPDGRPEQQQLDRQRMRRDQEEGPEVGYGLQNAVYWVERQPRERRQRVLLVVDVVDVMQIPAPSADTGR